MEDSKTAAIYEGSGLRTSYVTRSHAALQAELVGVHTLTLLQGTCLGLAIFSLASKSVLLETLPTRSLVLDVVVQKSSQRGQEADKTTTVAYLAVLVVMVSVSLTFHFVGLLAMDMDSSLMERHAI